jgi:hypothetical protein
LPLRNVPAPNDSRRLDSPFASLPMSAVLAAVAGAMFTAFSCQALGLCIVRKLTMPLSRLEEYLFAFFAGSAVFSLLMFAVLVAHAGYTPVIVMVGVACIALWLFRFRTGQCYIAAPGRLPKLWFAFALILCFRFTLLYVSRAIGPEYSSDGTTYHLAVVAEYLRKAHFPLITTNFYASLPEGLEMLFLAAFSIGRHSAAALVHLLFLFALSVALVLFGLRFQVAKAAIGAMVLFYLSPIVGFDASVAYNDVALAAACFAMFYALQIWVAQKDNDRLLILAGLFAGFAGAIKYTGFFAPVFSVGFVLWAGRASLAELKIRLAFVVIPASLLIAPWLIKNTIEVHNPVSPFANRLFRNPYTHISFEEEYRANMTHHNGVTRAEIPLEVTFSGARLQGIIGPVFLLSPLALFALSTPIGRQLLLVFVFFFLPYFSNIGTRFLIPSLPFLCLALCIVLESWRGSLVPVLALHFFLSWPGIVSIYAPGTMGLGMPRWDEALRRIPEEQVLESRLTSYGIARYMDQHLPASARILQFGGVPGAYMRQQIDDFYEGSQNEKASYLIWTGAFPELRSTQRHTFAFTANKMTSIRLEQTGEAEHELWKIGEIRLFFEGREILPRPEWMVTSRPNPWDTHLAFDGNLVTMWESWEHLRPGMYLEARFREPISIDRMEVDAPHDQASVHMIVKGGLSGGQKVTLSSTAAIETFPSPPDFLKKITATLRNTGYTHLVLASYEPCYKAIHADPAAWGMTLVSQRREYALYALGREQ